MKYKVTFKYDYDYVVDAENEYAALQEAEELLSDPDYSGYSVEFIPETEES